MFNQRSSWKKLVRIFLSEAEDQTGLRGIQEQGGGPRDSIRYDRGNLLDEMKAVGKCSSRVKSLPACLETPARQNQQMALGWPFDTPYCPLISSRLYPSSVISTTFIIVPCWSLSPSKLATQSGRGLPQSDQWRGSEK